MEGKEKLEQYIEAFMLLSDEGKRYVLAVQQALLFAQDIGTDAQTSNHELPDVQQ